MLPGEIRHLRTSHWGGQAAFVFAAIAIASCLPLRGSVVDTQIRFTDLDPSPLAVRLDQGVVSINRLIAAVPHRRSALIRDSSDLRRLVIERWMTPL